MTQETKYKATEITNPSPKLFQDRLRDDRRPVPHPYVWPSRCVGHIIIKFEDNTGTKASGALVSDYTVLTAGHVVKNANNEFKKIKKFQFVPAHYHIDDPTYGIYDWSKMKAVYDGEHGSRDWALISLAQPAGFQTGFLGVSAKYPINRWKSEGDHFQHIGYPCDHPNEMWIDEDGVCTDIWNGRQLKTDLHAVQGQSGGPLTINWGSSNPQVCGCASKGIPLKWTHFTPGYEDVKTGVWMQVLCDEYGKMHSDDRFAGCSTSISQGDTISTQGMLPNYNIPHVFSEDPGPVIRRFNSSNMSKFIVSD
ncbi:trypsin-like serine peptidase [Bacillus cereus]|uniref:trypsin-like serine peptidase n=1 Tax=Bacillus cereus TaxID=1396 RepID=UPI00217D1884|nr:trypsin-like serine protease [Bacillus cereus]MCS6595303.1 trypsin-like serine protease [Bacillus cereus]